ncbi:MAG TPA: FMN-dependent NADH-azoreductase [Rhodanobacter sp.]|jgi:FMN-dependent NADH-azoreductase|nr:FMN-dependent NADH-azoreductase [Rhodanobacter sp.]
MKLLHIDSSALGGHSVSRQLTADIVAELKLATPSLEIHYHDLAAQPLPHWTPVADASDPAAALGNEMLEHFLAADVIVIGAPMYNFAISSSLKAWIDRILVAGKTFRYTENGPEGLAGNKRVIIASSRGGFYGKDTPAAAMDFQEPYLRAAFAFIGIDEIEFVRAEGIAIGEEQKVAALQAARSSIHTLVAQAA